MTTDALDRRIAELEQVVTALASQIPDDRADREDAGEAVRDVRWQCRKCKSLLAFYDPEADVLRVRYKDHLAYFHVGEGGWVQIVCRGCGEPNEQRYATAEQIEAERAAAEGARRSRPGASAGAG